MLERFLPAAATSVLDVGCNVGDSLQWAYEHGIRRLIGIDINPEAVAKARARLAALPDVTLHHGSADAIPVAAASVDLVLCLEVLEHIPAQLRAGALREMARVLKPGGRLLLTTPHRGLFAWLDPENARFRLPAAWRLASRVAGGRGKEAGYEGQKHGVVFHEHFAARELRELLKQDYRGVKLIGRGMLIFPVMTAVEWPFYRRQRTDHPVFRAAARLMALDYAIRYPLPLAYNVVVVADRL